MNLNQLVRESVVKSSHLLDWCTRSPQRACKNEINHLLNKHAISLFFPLSWKNNKYGQ